MLTKAGVKVLDFGLAKSPEDANLSHADAVVGTPTYMAPAQREGRPATPAPTSTRSVWFSMRWRPENVV